MKVKVELAFAANQAYFDALLVTAVSAANYASDESILSYNILDGGINDFDWNFLVERVRKYHRRSEFRRLHLSGDEFNSLPSWYGNKMAYARLLLPQLLPDVDFVIYSDVDYLWLRDVTELWNMRDDKIPLFGTVDGYFETLRIEKEWHHKHNLSFDPHIYICSGMSLYNLTAFRNEHIAQKIIDFIAQHPDIIYPDQTAINNILFDRIKLVPQTWQRFTRAVTQDDLQRPIALHYAGEAPWKIGCWLTGMTDTRKFWFESLAEYRGITLLQAYKRYYPNILTALFRRFLSRWAACPIVNNILFLLLKVTKRDYFVSEFKEWSRPLSFDFYRKKV